MNLLVDLTMDNTWDVGKVLYRSMLYFMSILQVATSEFYFAHMHNNTAIVYIHKKLQ